MKPDVVVIGGGVIGLASAYRLRQDGLRVTVLDRQRCGVEASWASAGILTPCSWHRTDQLARMHMDALAMYADYAAQLHDFSGVDPQFIRSGLLKPIVDDNRLKMAANEVIAVGDRRMADSQPVVSTLQPDEVRDVEAHLHPPLLGAQYCRLSAQVRTPRLMQALYTACQRAGVEICENAPVRALLDHGGCVEGVRTEQGELHAGTTLLCAGAWSSGFHPALRNHVPVYPVRGQILLLHQSAPALERMIEVVEDKFYMVPRADGHVVVGSTQEHDSGFIKRNTTAGLSSLAQQALKHVPVLKNATLVRAWAGLRPGTPDRRPFLGAVPELRNMIAATGHYRTGLVLAPVTANIVCDLLKTGSCDYDLKKCCPGREYPQQADFSHLPWRN